MLGADKFSALAVTIAATLATASDNNGDSRIAVVQPTIDGHMLFVIALPSKLEGVLQCRLVAAGQVQQFPCADAPSVVSHQLRHNECDDITLVLIDVLANGSERIAGVSHAVGRKSFMEKAEEQASGALLTAIIAALVLWWQAWGRDYFDKRRRIYVTRSYLYREAEARRQQILAHVPNVANMSLDIIIADLAMRATYLGSKMPEIVSRIDRVIADYNSSRASTADINVSGIGTNISDISAELLSHRRCK